MNHVLVCMGFSNKNNVNSSLNLIIFTISFHTQKVQKVSSGHVFPRKDYMTGSPTFKRSQSRSKAIQSESGCPVFWLCVRNFRVVSFSFVETCFREIFDFARLDLRFENVDVRERLMNNLFQRQRLLNDLIQFSLG